MRVKQESLYDSEATLRLVDRVLEELDVSRCLQPLAGQLGYRTEQLSGAASDPDQATTFLWAYWELQEALERLRDGHAALQIVPEDAALVENDERNRMSQALAMVDQLRSEATDDRCDPVHEALQRELLALAEHLRRREMVSARIHRTADLLCDLEVRLSLLSRVFDSSDAGRMPM